MPTRACSAATCAIVSSSRSEEHTSELQSRLHLVCRLLLEKKKNKQSTLLIKHVHTTAITTNHIYIMDTTHNTTPQIPPNSTYSDHRLFITFTLTMQYTARQ